MLAGSLLYKSALVTTCLNRQVAQKQLLLFLPFCIKKNGENNIAYELILGACVQAQFECFVFCLPRMSIFS